MVRAAQEASRTAFILVYRWSQIFSLSIDSNSLVSTLRPDCCPSTFADMNLAIASFDSIPAFSARILGIIQKAFAQRLQLYWSSPFMALAQFYSLKERTVSVEPAPPTNPSLFIRALQTATASSTALSMSSISPLVDPLIKMVLSLQVEVSFMNFTIFSDPISSTKQESQFPRSSGLGAQSLDKTLVLVARATLLSSNLLAILTAMILYFYRQCRQMLLMVPPVMTRLTPALTRLMIAFSAIVSQPLAQFSIYSAFFMRTVPLVSAVQVSIEQPQIAIVGLSTLFIEVSASLFIMKPLITSESRMLEPMICTVLTLSTSKFLCQSGRERMQALATFLLRKSPQPESLEVSAGCRSMAIQSSFFRSFTQQHFSSARIQSAFFDACQYPVRIWLGCRPIFMRFQAWARNQPARVTTTLVPSPYSCCCMRVAITMILAAGCATSSSLRMVAASEVTKVLSMWFTTIFLRPGYLKIFERKTDESACFQVELPLGPKERLTMLAISRQALMFLSTTSSKPEQCLCPWWLGLSHNDPDGCLPL